MSGRRTLAVAFLIVLVSMSAPAQPVRVGADVLVASRLDLLRGRRVGLITNQTGRLASGEFLVDGLLSRGITVVALFGPEHGIRGGAEAGKKIGDSTDHSTGIPIYSLYDAVHRPTTAMLKNVDVLVYDIQDVGVRFYTYISTMLLCMEAAAEAGIDYIVLDRPNPLGGLVVDGPVLDDSLKSFVGAMPIPVVYGLTIGELATMANTEGWLKGRVGARLITIPMEGWTRGMHWSDTGLDWIPPSPNIRTPETVFVYPATCLLEATNISEGRGTSNPFHLIGAPFIGRSEELPRHLGAAHIPGLRFTDASFTPTSSKYTGVACYGAFLEFDPSTSSLPVRAGLGLLSLFYDNYPDSLKVNRASLCRLLGDPEAFDRIVKGESASSIAARWEERQQTFITTSRSYWQYPER